MINQSDEIVKQEKQRRTYRPAIMQERVRSYGLNDRTLLVDSIIELEGLQKYNLVFTPETQEMVKNLIRLGNVKISIFGNNNYIR